MAVKFLTGLNVEGNVIITPLNTTDTISFLNLGSNQSRLVTTNNFAIFNGGLETARFFTTGAFKLAEYGSGTFTGTATQRLGVDTSGNVIEIPIGSGAVDGSGTTNFVAKWLDTDTIGNSVIFDNGFNVGIGINGTYTNPPQRLTVISDDDIQPVAQFRNIGNGSGLFVRTDSTTLSLLELFSGGSYKFVVTGTGNVGIGTITPTNKLDVSGNVSATSLRIGSNASGEGIIRHNPGAGNGIGITTGALSSSDIGLFVSHQSTNRNVGIGTTSPSAKLDVAGTGNFTGLVSGITPVNAANFVTKAYADGLTPGAGVFLPLAGGTMTGTNGVVLPDNFKLNLGNSSDLQIYHDGSNSYIKDTGTGNLRIDATNFFVRNSNGSKLAIDAVDGAEVNLRYNGSKKFETTNTGVTVTGIASASIFSGDLNGTINTATTAVTKPDSTDDTTVATTAFVQNLIGTIPAGLVFQGTWNADTNTPTLVSGTGTTGHFYIVSTEGSTNLDGITDWKVGDWAVFVEQGATDAWQKVDNSSVLDGSGTGNQITKWAGSGTSNTLTDSIITDDGTNVGIGTTTPSAQLHSNASGSAINYGMFTIDTDNWINFFTGTGTAPGASAAGQGALFWKSGGVLRLGTSTSTAGAGFVDMVRIDTDGNVGIGTTNPTNKLEVISAANEEGIAIKDSSGNLKYKIRQFGGNSYSTFWDSSNTEKVKITSGGSSFFNGGDVGIGTTSPTYKLEVAGKSYLSGGIQLNSGDEIDFGNSQQYITGVNNNSLTLVTGNSATLTALNSGQIQINSYGSGTFTGTAAYNLSVDSNGNIIETTAGSGGSSNWTLTGNDIYNNNSRNVGIGTTSPSAKLQVAGGVQMADDTDTASADKVGTQRYREDSNNSYVDMCMKTDNATYEWVNIVQNNW